MTCAQSIAKVLSSSYNLKSRSVANATCAQKPSTAYTTVRREVCPSNASAQRIDELGPSETYVQTAASNAKKQHQSVEVKSSNDLNLDEVMCDSVYNANETHDDLIDFTKHNLKYIEYIRIQQTLGTNCLSPQT